MSQSYRHTASLSSPPTQYSKSIMLRNRLSPFRSCIPQGKRALVSTRRRLPRHGVLPGLRSIAALSSDGGGAHQQRNKCGVLWTATAATFLALHLNKQQTTQLETSSGFKLDDTYELTGEVLGEGGYGKVFRARRKSDATPVAIKAIDPELTDKAECDREISALKTLSQGGGHPNVCKLFDVYRSGETYYVAMEIIEGGELLEHLILGGAYSEADAANFVRELAEAVSYMHRSGIAHADLKCENVMLSSWDMKKARVKVIDFGSAMPTDENGRGVGAGEFRGTSAYCSPELLREAGPPTLASDMFAVGCIVYVILTGTHPFDAQGNAADEDIEQLIMALKPGPSGERLLHALVFDDRVTGLSESCIDLMKRLMDPNPCTRMTADEFRRHPWVQSLQASWEKMADRNNKLRRFWQRQIRTKILRKYAVAASDEGSLSDSNLRHIFHSIDLDGNGVLDAHELRVALRQLGVTEENASLMIASVDLDMNGEIDMGEFFAIMRSTFNDGPGVRIANQKRFQTAVLSMLTGDQGGTDPLSDVKRLRRAFNAIDLDGNGVLDFQEIRTFLRHFGVPDESIAQIIADVDLDNSGAVEWEEFVAIMHKTFDGESGFQYKGRHTTHPLYSTP